MSELKRPAGSFEGRIGVSPSNREGIPKQIVITADKDVAKELDNFFLKHGIVSQVESCLKSNKLLLRIDMK